MNDLKKSKDIGDLGEDKIRDVILRFNFWFKKGKILRNLYIPMGDGETTELDLVYITKKGVFAIESKNYSALIIGKPNDEYWKVKYYGGNTYSLYNPIKQNSTHILNLRKIVGDSIPIYSVIIFSNQSNINNVRVIGKHHFVIQQHELKGVLKDVWKSTQSFLTNNEVVLLYKLLLPYTQVSEEVKQKHIETVEKYKKIEEIVVDKVKNNDEEKGKIIHTGQGKEEERRVCPCCGKGLILRTSKQNKNFGNKFYGCMGYPDCTYTESLEEYNRKRNLEEYLNNADYSFYCKNYNIRSNVSLGGKKRKWF